MTLFPRLVIAVAAALSAVAARAEDPRAAIRLPAEVKASFLEEMRGHMDALDAVIGAIAAGDLKGAAAEARGSLGIGSGKGHGRFMPQEFRAMGMAMHRAALDFADVAAAVGTPPSAAEWTRLIGALQGVSTNCRGCHATFRIE